MGSVKIGAVGGYGHDIWDHRGRTQIVQIIISYGSSSINSLRFQYLEDDHLHTSEIVGCQNFTGPMVETITFDNAPNEYITKVEGIYGSEIFKLRASPLLYKIFEKTDSTSTDTTKWFCFNFGGLNQFGGFHGRYDSTGLRSIGVYFNNLTALPSTIHNIPEDPSPNDIEDEDYGI